MLGPLFYYDLLGLLRRPRFIAVRCLYALALLIALFCLYASWFGLGSFGEPLSPSREAAFATDFFFTFLAVQLAAVLVLTPAYTSVAIAEEREAGRLDFLLTSELSNREIVLGKFAARLGSVALILLTGLPILALMQFLGGVDPNLVLAGFAATLATMVSVGSFGVWVSVNCERTYTSLWWTYVGVVAVLLAGWCCPGLHLGHPAVVYDQLDTALHRNDDLASVLLWLVTGYTAVHALVAVASLCFAILLLRPVFGPAPAAPPPAPRPAVVVPPPPNAEIWAWPRPPVSDNALLWKEMHLCALRLTPEFRQLLNVWAVLIALYVGVIFGAMLFGASQTEGSLREILDLASQALCGFAVGLASLLWLGIALRAASTVSRECEQGTLDSLLTLPVDRRDILWAKWLGSILSARLWSCVLLALWLFCVLVGGLHPLSGLLLVTAFLAFTACTAAWALLCSVVSPNRRYATLFTLLGLVAWNLAPCLMKEPYAHLSPVLSLWALDFPPDGVVIRWGAVTPSGPSSHLDQSVEVSFACLGVLFAAVWARIFWQLAMHRFEAESGRRPT
ncbi:MAG: ABC transporter permease subunit [Planctomycetia bacterium]|nr:ABC transporter permease subunit [Planctomycetia bacterium]